MLLIAEIDQRVEVLDALRPHVPALTAVTAVRAAVLDELLAPEADASGPAIAGADIDFGLVEELHESELSGSGLAAASIAAVVLFASAKVDGAICFM